MDPDGDVAPRRCGRRATEDIGIGHSLVTKLYFVKSL